MPPDGFRSFSPFAALRDELGSRYLQFYGFRPSDSLQSHLKGIVPATYVAAFAAGLIARRSRTEGAGMLLWLAGIYVGGLAVFDSTRQPYYLVYAVTAMAVVFAAMLCAYAGRGSLYRFGAVGAACAVALVNLGTLGYRSVRLDTMHNGFLPALAYLEKSVPAGSVIMGSGEFGFGLGFDGGLTDDPALGYYSGKKPDFIVVDPLTYQENFKEFRRTEPHVYRHIMNMLAKDCARVYDQGSYQVYARRQNRLAP
jgi:hypothetical protein